MEDSSEPKKISAIEFAKEKLRLNPDATYAELKAQAKFEGIPLFPVVYGRAKSLLGLVPTAPYGSKSKARKQAAADKAAREQVAAEPAEAETPSNGSSARTERLRVKASEDTAAGLEAMIADLRTVVQERDRYRAVLEKITALIEAELSA